jgi:hypothetical protein
MEHSVGLSCSDCLRFDCADSHLEGGTARGTRSRGVERPGATAHSCARRRARSRGDLGSRHGGRDLHRGKGGLASLRCFVRSRCEVLARARGSPGLWAGEARVAASRAFRHFGLQLGPSVFDTLRSPNPMGIVGRPTGRPPHARALAAGQPDLAVALHCE